MNYYWLRTMKAVAYDDNTAWGNEQALSNLQIFGGTGGEAPKCQYREKWQRKSDCEFETAQ